MTVIEMVLADSPNVRDTGIGVAVDKQHMIFEPFSQVDGSARREFGGTGLGLAIAAPLVEMMGGRIWVESDGRTGSTFHFTVHLKTVRDVADSTPNGADRAVLPPAKETKPARNIGSASGESRRSPRFETDGIAAMTVLDPLCAVESEVRVLNVSKGGLKLGVGERLDPGSLVQIRIKGRFAMAEVRYCVRANQGFHVGVQLQDTFQ